MKNVSRLLPLLPGIALLTGCNQKVQKDNGQNSQKPNIIYIFADDLGIGDLSCYGATKVSTPHIDRLAGQGVQFTNAYATSATSTSSRFGLLTGHEGECRYDVTRQIQTEYHRWLRHRRPYSRLCAVLHQFPFSAFCGQIA